MDDQNQDRTPDIFDRADDLRKEWRENGTGPYAAPATEQAKADLSGLINLLQEIKPRYGMIGSRDDEVAAQRKRIEDAIDLLAAITKEQK